MQTSWEKGISAMLALAALAIAVVAVRREFFTAAAPIPVSAGRHGEYVSSWQDILPIGRVVGDSSARVKLIEFSDLECPFCRTYNTTIGGVLQKYPRDVALIFVHRPLPPHRFARPAARVAECAVIFGKFREVIDVLYQKQDSLGLIPWTSFAQASGITDTTSFARCAADTASMAAVEAGVAMADKLGINGTPTVILNGWRYSGPPSEPELHRAIEDLLAGRQPYPNFPVAVKGK